MSTLPIFVSLRAPVGFLAGVTRDVFEIPHLSSFTRLDQFLKPILFHQALKAGNTQVRRKRDGTLQINRGDIPFLPTAVTQQSHHGRHGPPPNVQLAHLRAMGTKHHQSTACS